MKEIQLKKETNSVRIRIDRDVKINFLIQLENYDNIYDERNISATELNSAIALYFMTIKEMEEDNK